MKKKKEFVVCPTCPFVKICFGPKEKVTPQIEDFCPVAKLIRGNVKVVSEGKILYKLTS